MGRRTVLVLTVVGIAFAATAAQADEIRVRPGRRALQRALDRAKPGDRLVLRGPVRDDVTIDVPGVTIDGGGRARISANITVAADGVTITRTKFKRAELRVTGDGAAIVDSRILGTPVSVEGDDVLLARNEITPGYAGGAAIDVIGDAARVEENVLSEFSGGVRVEGAEAVVSGNSFEGGDMAVTVVGDDASVAGNTTTGSPAEVVVEGDRATLSDNQLQGPASVLGDDADVSGNQIVAGETALTVSGDRAVVTDNTLSSSSGGAIVDGDDATISDNVVTVPSFGDGAGIVSVGDGALISGNDVTVQRPWDDGTSGVPDVRLDLDTSANDGIASFGDGGLVKDNEVDGTFAGGAAVRVQGDDNDVDSNSVHDASQVYSVVLIGDDNEAASNEVSDVEGEGVIVQGDGGVVSDTSVSGVTSCGFLLIGDTRLEGCTATNCGMGVVNLSGLSKIVDTTVSGNAPYDLVDLGKATVTGGNVGWIATDPASFPDWVALIANGFVPAPAPRVLLGAPDTAN